MSENKPFRNLPSRIVDIFSDAWGLAIQTHEYERAVETLESLGYEVDSKFYEKTPEGPLYDIKAVAVHPWKRLSVTIEDWDLYKRAWQVIVRPLDPVIPSDSDDELKSMIEAAADDISRKYDETRGKVMSWARHNPFPYGKTNFATNIQ